MEMADFWLTEKQLIHKLFKVLVPRYQSYNSSFTRLILGPKTYPGHNAGLAILELKGFAFKQSTLFLKSQFIWVFFFQDILFLRYNLKAKITTIGCIMFYWMKQRKNSEWLEQTHLNLLNQLQQTVRLNAYKNSLYSSLNKTWMNPIKL